MADGVIPSNEGRGYVLRKIMRRALRHAKALDPTTTELILPAMAQIIRENMGEAYPEINENVPRVNKILSHEEQRFARTVEIGLKRLDSDLVR